MLTNKEALRLIKECEQCFVVWATDRNVIATVHPMPSHATEEDFLKALASMGADYDGPSTVIFLNSKDVTLQTLQDQQAEMAGIAGRVEIFNSWSDCSVGQLIDIVISQRFCEPMDVLQGSLHIVERLYKIHGPRLTEGHLDKLEQFARAADVHCDQKSAQLMLRCFLAVLKSNPSRLKELWEPQIDPNIDWYRNPNIDWWAWPALTDAAGDLPTTDREIIEHLITVVETPFMFAPRYSAMVALGKIGPPAGERAIEVITESICDSSEHVTAIRDRVVARIQAPASSWVRCSHCHRGYVDAMAFDIPSVEECVECLGLGHVPRSAS